MDLCAKVIAALERVLGPSEIDLKDDDGIIGYVVSAKFRQIEHFDRQALIYDALRDPLAGLDEQELRRVIAIAALTPEEQIAYSTD